MSASYHSEDLITFVSIGLFIISLFPWIFALASQKAKGNTKVIWFLLSFFLSWLGYFVYYFVVIRPQWVAQKEKLKRQAIEEEEERRRNRLPRTQNGMPLKDLRGRC